MKRGYTLIELVVVLVILVLAGGVMVPALAAWRPPTDIAAARGRVVSVAQLARERAVTSGGEVELVIDATNQRVWLRPRDTSFVLSLPDGCRLVGEARSVIRFAADGPARGTVPEISCGAERAQLVVDPLTGMAR